MNYIFLYGFKSLLLELFSISWHCQGQRYLLFPSILSAHASAFLQMFSLVHTFFKLLKNDYLFYKARRQFLIKIRQERVVLWSLNFDAVHYWTDKSMQCHYCIVFFSTPSRQFRKVDTTNVKTTCYFLRSYPSTQMFLKIHQFSCVKGSSHVSQTLQWICNSNNPRITESTIFFGRWKMRFSVSLIGYNRIPLNDDCVKLLPTENQVITIKYHCDWIILQYHVCSCNFQKVTTVKLKPTIS